MIFLLSDFFLNIATEKKKSKIHRNLVKMQTGGLSTKEIEGKISEHNPRIIPNIPIILNIGLFVL